MSNHFITRLYTSRSPSERTEASLELALLGKCVLQTLLSNYSQGNTRFVWNQMQLSTTIITHFISNT